MSTGWVVGGLWVLLGKIKCAAIWVGLCVGIAALLILRSVGIFVCRFTVCLMSVVSSVTLAPNVFGLGEGGDFHHKC